MKKNTVLLIVLIVAVIGVIGGSVIAYRGLSGKVSTPTTTEASTIIDSSPVITEEATSAEKQPAPDFTVKDADGNSVSLSDKIGKPIIINFWATWCPPCRSELPYFDRFYTEYGDKVEFMMIDLTDGTRETAEGVLAFIEENGYTFPVYYDSDTSAALTYQISSIPLTVLIDEDGNIVERHLGLIDEATLQTYLESLA